MSENKHLPDIENYTLDDGLINHVLRTLKPQARVYIPDDLVVVLGRGSDPEKEVNLEKCTEDGVTLQRRHGGGCAVMLDPGCLVVSIVTPTKKPGKINEYFDYFSEWLIDGLTRCGVEGVHREGISDLAIGDRKIAGACMQRKSEYMFYSASLLVDSRVDLMEMYIKHPPREPSYRKGRNHTDFITTIMEASGIYDIYWLENALTQTLKPTKDMFS